MIGKRIVLIGAGSIVFSYGLTMDLVLSPHLAGSTLVLVDIDQEKLALMARIAQRLIDHQGAHLRLETTTDRRQALPGADSVIATISVNGQAMRELDANIPLKYGIVQPVADTVGPGGLMRAMRHVPVMLDVARDIVELCPDATLYNYSNPNTVICRAIARETPIRVVGLCHGVPNTRRYLADYMELPPEELEVRAAGINHLVWMVHLLHNGRDAYPRLREVFARKGPDARPASFELMQIHGLFPGPGHEHIVEFYPYFTSPQAEYGKRYGVAVWSASEVNQRRTERLEGFHALAEGSAPVVMRPSGEDVMEIMTAMVTHVPKLCAVNVPNHGAVYGLQDDAVVEVSAWVDGGGIQPLRFERLPAGIEATLRARIDQQELTVDAAITGDCRVALQSLLAENAVGSVAQAQAMLDELLKANEPYLRL